MSKRAHQHALPSNPGPAPELPPEIWGLVLSYLPLASEATSWLQLMRVSRLQWQQGLAQLNHLVGDATLYEHVQRYPIQHDPRRQNRYATRLMLSDDLAATVKFLTECDRSKPNEELLQCVLSLLCNVQIQVRRLADETFQWHPVSRKAGPFPGSNDKLSDVFYRKKGHSALYPLLSHRKLRVARQGTDKEAVEAAQRHLKKTMKKKKSKHYDRAAIYASYLAQSMAATAKRALCYTIVRPELVRAGPRDKVTDAVLDGQHLFSDLHPSKRYEFFLRRGKESPDEKLRSVRLWKRGAPSIRKTVDLLRRIRQIERAVRCDSDLDPMERSRRWHKRDAEEKEWSVIASSSFYRESDESESDDLW